MNTPSASSTFSKEVRDKLVLPRDVAYFNTAFFSPMLATATSSGLRGVEQRSKPWDLSYDDFSIELDVLRSEVASLAGTDANNVAIVPSASYGLATVCANTKTVGTRNQVVLLKNEHPSNVLQWQRWADREDGELLVVDTSDPAALTAKTIELIDERTAAVSITPGNWADGTSVDLEAVSATCTAAGATLTVDLTQSLGVQPVDCRSFDADHVVVAGYKWLFGPYSVSYLIVNPDRHSDHPIEISKYDQGTSNGAFSWAGGKLQYPEEWQPGARRFDVGEKANFCLIPLAVDGVRQVNEWTVAKIHERVAEISRTVKFELEERGFEVSGGQLRMPNILCANFGERASDVREQFDALRVCVSWMEDRARFSFHAFNDQEDIDRLVGALEQASRIG